MQEKEIFESNEPVKANKDENSAGTIDTLHETSANEAEGIEIKDDEIEKLKREVLELKDKYVRQAADFDNFRKRNAKERLELIQTAGKEVIISLLEVLDDCDRAQQQIEKQADLTQIKEGISLIFSKLRNTLQSKGLKPMQCKGEEFNPDLHEAITETPAPTEDLKGKVIDEVEKGYYLNDKIIRFAKVVVGK